ncbi:hypothetical protein [Yersinia ruckeri]|uniref:hypothetical protein n=1 Tax=Yersinia ruckeri TaxID=29486 RepID=UPI0005391C01|nr:hypothetical protein [Yersinia ruckeri]AUQ43846.1 hypothetical protein NJ56_17915 [Yersinia ruckeri]
MTASASTSGVILSPSGARQYDHKYRDILNKSGVHKNSKGVQQFESKKKHRVRHRTGAEQHTKDYATCKPKSNKALLTGIRIASRSLCAIWWHKAERTNPKEKAKSGHRGLGQENFYHTRRM